VGFLRDDPKPSSGLDPFSEFRMHRSARRTLTSDCSGPSKKAGLRASCKGWSLDTTEGDELRGAAHGAREARSLGGSRPVRGRPSRRSKRLLSRRSGRTLFYSTLTTNLPVSARHSAARSPLPRRT
jgi:hypothetical protein